MAQLVAHLLCMQGVRGSSPLGSTTNEQQPLGGFLSFTSDSRRASMQSPLIGIDLNINTGGWASLRATRPAVPDPRLHDPLFEAAP